MSRKFNIGRLDEQLMRSETFNAYNMIKYLGNQNVTPIQDRQSAIQHGSLWNDTTENKNVLKTYNSQTGLWTPLFEGYYHPMNTTTMPAKPYQGQLWVDGNGILRYYEDLQWKVVQALSCNDAVSTHAGLSNFMIMPELSQITGFANNYIVPSVVLGKLFEENNFIPRTKYVASDVSFSYDTTDRLTWIHVNPTFLYGAKKKLIRINKTGNDAFVINLPTNNTEFYGYNFGDSFGKLLTYIPKSYNVNQVINQDSIINDTRSDYVPVTGGIKLINNGQTYDYIYAITYSFQDVVNTFGQMATNTVKIGSENQIYVGQINDDPILFLNGLYLEQDYYSYNQYDGVITFNGDTITESMDMVVLSFDKLLKNNDKILEIEITEENIQNKNIIVTNNNFIQIENFNNPVAFISGISTSIRMEDQIRMNGDTITIYNFGDIEEGSKYTLTIVDVGNSYISHGYVVDNCIEDINIKNDKQYALFINGLCMSPREFEINEGKILVSGNLKPIDGESCEYYLMCINEEEQTNNTQLLFDSPVSYFTTRIEDKNDSAVYNNCNMVVAYAYNEDNSKNGLLIDKNFIDVPLDTEGTYITGQVLNIRTEDEFGDPHYDYHIYNMNGDYTWTKFIDEFGVDDLNTLENMITQFNSDGSISIMSNRQLQDCYLTYFAYTYSDEIDEPLITGKRNCVINVNGHINTASQIFYTSKLHTFMANKGCISAFVNGIQEYNTYDYPSELCKFSIDTPLSHDFINWKNRDMYNTIKNINESTTVEDLELLGFDEYAFDSVKLEYMKRLSDSINKMETENELYYIVERVEQNESYACTKIRTGPQNRYDNFDNTYTSSSYIGPGAINIYLNGVLLEKSEYSIFDNCNIILNKIHTAGGSDEFTREDPNTWTLIKYYTEDDGKVHRLYCKEADELLIELRPDTSIKKASYDIKEISYETQAFDIIDYDYPKSLKNTKDKIKIYINGVIYTGKYSNNNGVIILEDAPLQVDPIKIYFDSHPDEYREYKKEHGQWISTKDRITFEWR